MSDTVFTVGGSDSYYGTYGGSGIGPTSYNPYGTGSPGASVLGHESSPSPASISNQYTGRVANNTLIQVLAENDTKLEATGTPATLLVELNTILAKTYADDKYNADKIPSLYMPSIAGVRAIDFADVPTFQAYLTRSTSDLIPVAAVQQTFTGVLGRPAKDADIANLENDINAGGTLATIQWSLAHSAEAQLNLDNYYVAYLGRSIDQPSSLIWQDQLGHSSSGFVSGQISHSPEAAAQLDVIYQDALGRPIDPYGLTVWQQQLRVSSLDTVRTSIAHSDEATAAVRSVFTVVLGRAATATDIQFTEDNNLAGGASLANVAAALAQSPEARDRLNDIYMASLGRPIDAYGLTVWRLQ